MKVELSNQAYFDFTVLLNGKKYSFIFKLNTRDNTYYFKLLKETTELIHNAPVEAGFDYMKPLNYKVPDEPLMLTFVKTASTGNLFDDYIMEFNTYETI